jgi:hypothetical protein
VRELIGHEFRANDGRIFRVAGFEVAPASAAFEQYCPVFQLEEVSPSSPAAAALGDTASGDTSLGGRPQNENARDTTRVLPPHFMIKIIFAGPSSSSYGELFGYGWDWLRPMAEIEISALINGTSQRRVTEKPGPCYVIGVPLEGA